MPTNDKLIRCYFVSFNPRPPLPGGDALQLEGWRYRLFTVSIHAPRCREAMPSSRRQSCALLMFQSTPPVAGRRCLAEGTPVQQPDVSIHAPRCREAMRQHLRLGQSRYRVSIHAPRCREAMPIDDFLSAITYWVEFQSTPPVAGRRCTTVGGVASATVLFQSTPPVAGRRCRGGRRRKRTMQSFNPRPPLPGGDARSSPKLHG
ncbi:MAG: hypothetical protein FD131_2866 [Rhodocyclaceae bacterium]|nr:MAG: hypothetical protein FD131_2866 [Rhodocyclaceae bacterium]